MHIKSFTWIEVTDYLALGLAMPALVALVNRMSKP